jgi:catechol 2,3-dioxygenase-like lactoylglutathione lyase family enzyme
MRATRLDHVALWLEDRDSLADFLVALGLHEIERTERFTLLGTDARRGKLTLFAATGPRQPGALKHVALRVSDLEAALRAVPDGYRPELSPATAAFTLEEGLELRLVEAATDVEFDLDHVALWSAEPSVTAAVYGKLGFAKSPPRGDALCVEAGGAYVEFHLGEPGPEEQPLLNHIAVLVDAAAAVLDEAQERGLAVDDVVDAANTYAVFLRVRDGVRVEYVEHKASFALT